MPEPKLHLLKPKDKSDAHADVLSMLEIAVKEIKECKSENVLVVFLSTDSDREDSPVNLHISTTTGLNQIALGSIAKECVMRNVFGE